MSLASTLLEGYNGYGETINDPISYLNEAAMECITGLYEASKEFYTGDIVGQTQVLMEGANAGTKLRELWDNFSKRITTILDKFIEKFKKVIDSLKKKSNQQRNTIDEIRKKFNDCDKSSKIEFPDILNGVMKIDDMYDYLIDKTIMSDSISKLVCASDVVEDISDTLKKMDNFDIELDTIMRADWRHVFKSENKKPFDDYITDITHEREMLNKAKFTEIDISTAQKVVDKAESLLSFDDKAFAHFENAIKVLGRWKKDLSDPSFIKNVGANAQQAIAILQKRITSSLDFYNQMVALCEIHKSAATMMITQVEIGLSNLKE